MSSTVLLGVCAPCAAVLTLVWAAAALAERGANPLAEVCRRYRKLPRLAQVLLPVLAVRLIVFGSTKAPTNGVPGEGLSPTNAPALSMVWPGPQNPDPLFDSGFAPDELSAGHALWRVGTNETWSFGAMPGAHVVEKWRLRGAAEDWTCCETTNLGPVVLDTHGRIVTTNGVFAALDAQLSVVPEANWHGLGTNAPSCVWWAETPWASTVFTWQNVLLNRETGTPVSVQAEFTKEGDFIYRYDLAAAGRNLTSELYYRIRPEDLVESDRDGDGVMTVDEITRYHSDPGLVDSDGDGIADGEEVWRGTDPSVRSVPNGEIVARIAGSATNEQYRQAMNWGPDRPLVSLKLWDGFAADWPAGRGDLVYERALDLGDSNGWQHYFLSSKEDSAGGWDLRGLVLEWDDGRGNSGRASASPEDDSWLLPVTNSTVTIRLRATGPKIRCPKPMYLIGYAPAVTLSGGQVVDNPNGAGRAHVLLGGAGDMTVRVTIDRSHRPCKAAPSPAEMSLPGLDDLASVSSFQYEGGPGGGLIRLLVPGCHQLPSFSVDDPASRQPRRLRAAASGGGTWLIRLDPSVDFSGKHRFVSAGLSYEDGRYCVEYLYPLDSKCLWRSWQQGDDGGWECRCIPVVKAGGGADSLPFVETSSSVNADRSVATGRVKVYGTQVWSKTAAHSWQDVGGGGGRTRSGTELLSEMDGCDGCDDDCADGSCGGVNGASLNSVKFRLSLGEPRRGQHSGFVYFESDDPVRVVPELFSAEFRADATVWTEHSATATVYRCHDNRGRDVFLLSITNGVRLVVNDHRTGALDETWEIVNEGGDTNAVRVTEISRLGNVLSDETFVCDENGAWSRTDNVTGVVETMERVNRLNDSADGKLYVTRTKRDADGRLLDRVRTEFSRIGGFSGAVLRETCWERDTGEGVSRRWATYWEDSEHRDRHGRVKLVRGNGAAWEYHDYDENGHEILCVEQRNGSPVPAEFPSVYAGEPMFTGGLADATVTVFGYEPFEGDDGNRDDADEVRCETRYVVRNGRAVCVARTWTRYAHVTCNGRAAVRVETWRAAEATAPRTDARNAYSYVIAYSETEAGVPLVLRGRVAEELDENGVRTCRDARVNGAILSEEVHRWHGDREFPTYEVTERDLDFGNVLRRATCLVDGRVVVDEEVSAYDDKNRLRSTAYADGTSLTNAFSCCRELWSVDREGRKTLRSAVSGQDRLYHAEEEVWLCALSTNGACRVTQRFFDGLGRETNTVVCVGVMPGAFAVPPSAAASVASPVSSSVTFYPHGGDDRAVTVDGRGKMTVSESAEYEDRTESLESVYADRNAAVPELQTRTTQVRNGMRMTQKTWGGMWTREMEIDDHDADGCAVRYEVTESSDCGTVTNRVVTCDFLGRTVREVTPLGTTATTYHGATGRVNATILTAGDVTSASTVIYDELGEEVGREQDGVTSRTDELYETDTDGTRWRVRRSTRTADGCGPEIVRETRERLTGLGAGLRSERIEIDANGVAKTTVVRCDATNGTVTTTVALPLSAPCVRVAKCGLVLSERTGEGESASSYDAFGRCVRRTRNGRIGETQAYNALGDVIERRVYTNDVGFVTETFGYDACGRQTSAADALGNAVVTRYDAVGNVVERSGATWPVRFAYDTAGRRVSLSTTKDGRTWDETRWTYDPATGKCTAKRYPDGSQIAYALTPDGLELRETKASGAWREFVYDSRRLRTATVFSDPTLNATCAYDAFGRSVAETNAAAGIALARAKDGTATNETWCVGRHREVLVRQQDSFGRIEGRGLLDGDWQSVSYAEGLRIGSIAATEATVSYAYAEDGSELGYGLALMGDGATVERRVIRDSHRPDLIVAVSNFVNGTAVCCETYAHDAKGRVAVRENEARETRDEFAYDAFGQVVSERAEPRAVTSPGAFSASYAYDQAGNFAGREVSYDCDGRFDQDGDLTFAYDAAGHLGSVASNGVVLASYAYDSQERRVLKVTPTATHTYFYDGWLLVREVVDRTGGDSETIDYCWGRDRSGGLDGAGGVGGLLTVRVSGAVYVPLYDRNGNVTAYVDRNGTVVAQYAYDAFGAVRSATGPMAGVFRFRFSTKYADPESGLLYYGYRYYSPARRVWLVRDPLGEDAGANLHAFCKNDPVNGYDALGGIVCLNIYDLRMKWLAVVAFFRMRGWTVASELLLHSLQNSPSSPYMLYGAADKVRRSREYRMMLDEFLSELDNGRWTRSRYQHVKDIEFKSDQDLLYALHAAQLWVRGSVCKAGAKIKCPAGLDVEIRDDYDFHWHDLEYLSKHPNEHLLVTLGNNIAWVDSELGVIRPFRSIVKFRENNVGSR